MMNYCEKCNTAFEEDFCTSCGNKQVRPVNDDDFCFLFTISKELGDILKEKLNEINIECAIVPYGDGVRSLFGLSLEYYNTYVPFKHYNQALDIYKELYLDATNNLRKQLLNNSDKWYFSKDKTVKKIMKKLKLKSCGEVLDYVKQKVMESPYVYEDHTCTHYIIVITDKSRIFFDFNTYEIYSI